MMDAHNGVDSCEGRKCDEENCAERGGEQGLTMCVEEARLE